METENEKWLRLAKIKCEELGISLEEFEYSYTLCSCGKEYHDNDIVDPLTNKPYEQNFVCECGAIWS